MQLFLSLEHLEAIGAATTHSKSIKIVDRLVWVPFVVPSAITIMRILITDQQQI
jgi:hypothetical protein